MHFTGSTEAEENAIMLHTHISHIYHVAGAVLGSGDNSENDRQDLELTD